uniref:Uncharacterized protein n=1 Tax=Magnetococcus massalia (strain MO-1) TaxID=451514 RepID=A0A1S7LG83_MAGMO|nr:protein of unknown function [Candidatus Magnetococcus massalia]
MEPRKPNCMADDSIRKSESVVECGRRFHWVSLPPLTLDPQPDSAILMPHLINHLLH